MTVYAQDSFDRADGALGTADVGGAWSAIAGTDAVGIVSNTARQTAVSVGVAMAKVGPSLADLTLSFDYQNNAPGRGYTGVFARFQDTGNYYACLCQNGSAPRHFNIWKVVGGVATDIAFYDVGFGVDNYNAGIRLDGNTLTLLLSGAPVASITDTDLPAAGDFGIVWLDNSGGSDGWILGNFLVESNPAPPPIPVFTDEQLLEWVDPIGIRVSCFRFDLLDANDNLIRELHPAFDQPPSITNDTTRSVMRTLDNLLLTPDEAIHVNTLTDRVRPVMVLQNGSEYPMGTFIWSDASQALGFTCVSFPTSGAPITGADANALLTGALLDQTIIIDQPTDVTWQVNPGVNIRSAILEVCARLGVTAEVDATSAVAGSPLVFPIAKQKWRDVIVTLGKIAGFHPPYFDNHGTLRLKAVTDPLNRPPSLIYADNRNIYDDTIVISDDQLSAPNRYVAIDSSATAGPVSAVLDIPASAPNSFAKRGFHIVRVVTSQGLATTTQALDAARAAYAADAATAVHVEFSGPPDPRHDTFDTIEFRGELYVETAWTLPLQEGAPMRHQLQKVFT